MSEYGFQSFPSIESWKEVSLPSDWAPFSDFMVHRSNIYYATSPWVMDNVQQCLRSQFEYLLTSLYQRQHTVNGTESLVNQIQYYFNYDLDTDSFEKFIYLSQITQVWFQFNIFFLSLFCHHLYYYFIIMIGNLL